MRPGPTQFIRALQKAFPGPGNKPFPPGNISPPGNVPVRNLTAASHFTRHAQNYIQRNSGKVILMALFTGAAGSSVMFYFISAEQNKRSGKFMAGQHKSLSGKPEHEKRKLTARERRFLRFATVEYDGQIYMTPQDFLESVVEGGHRPRVKRKLLNEKEMEEMRPPLPKIAKNNEQFFRNLGNQGIISFSEYLFLLTILIKPQSGFKIAFAMLDQDGNERIDKSEFKVLETVFSSAARERKQNDLEAAAAASSSSLLSSSSSSSEATTEAVAKAADAVNADAGKAVAFDDDEYGLHRMHAVDTTLLLYFFGPKGQDQLRFEDFHHFMDNLQTEVLQMEFQEFSKGTRIISELDFARILLKYTYLNAQEYEIILDRLADRLQLEVGVTFEEFKDFCLFLNNLDDFQIAMRMYTLADKAISEDEFSRAVTICTGRKLSPHLVHTVFQIFDDDGDGLLTYQEFVAMMKDRVNRGLKSFTRLEGWTGFKKCVKQEVRQGGSGGGGVC